MGFSWSSQHWNNIILCQISLKHHIQIGLLMIQPWLKSLWYPTCLWYNWNVYDISDMFMISVIFIIHKMYVTSDMSMISDMLMISSMCMISVITEFYRKSVRVLILETRQTHLITWCLISNMFNIYSMCMISVITVTWLYLTCSWNLTF